MVITRYCLVVMLAAVLTMSGCAAQHPFVGLPDVPSYRPASKSEGTSPAAAKLALQELFSRNPGIKTYQIPGINMYLLRDALISLVKEGNDRYQLDYNSDEELVYMVLSRLRLLDDRIVLSDKVALKFDDMVNTAIVVERVGEEDASIRYRVHVGSDAPGWTRRFYRTRVAGWADFLFEKYEDAVRCADNLYVIQQAKKNTSDDRQASFAAKATQYREAKVKPAVTEAQRKLIVQANVMNQQKEYAKAIDYYLKAVDVDPVAYPAAYFNLALLAAQMQWYSEAIGYMQQYLQLAPDAKDVRSAQDKIYEWEALLGK
jgi:tetratricopeptide (TPR) repeat protein